MGTLSSNAVILSAAKDLIQTDANSTRLLATLGMTRP